jgi:hypothetical protein
VVVQAMIPQLLLLLLLLLFLLLSAAAGKVMAGRQGARDSTGPLMVHRAGAGRVRTARKGPMQTPERDERTAARGTCRCRIGQ